MGPTLHLHFYIPETGVPQDVVGSGRFTLGPDLLFELIPETSVDTLVSARSLRTVGARYSGTPSVTRPDPTSEDFVQIGILSGGVLRNP